jgi:uncharacterized protein
LGSRKLLASRISLNTFVENSVTPSKGKIVIAGGSGFLGRACQNLFESNGYQIVVLTRTPNAPHEREWDGKTVGVWVRELEGAVAVINLAGSPIAVKFSQENLDKIKNSRIDPTNAIGDALLTLAVKPMWVNASAVGFYGDTRESVADETTMVGTGILPDICKAWEAAVLEHSVRCPKVILRIGVVFGRDAGALKPLKKLTQCFLGGAVGDGKQYMSWVHVEDLARQILWLIEGHKEGIYNGTAPNPTTNSVLMASLRRQLNRPWSPPAPAFVIKLIGKLIGPDASLLLDSQRALPKRATEEGFQFRFEKLDDALRNLLG